MCVAGICACALAVLCQASTASNRFVLGPACRSKYYRGSSNTDAIDVALRLDCYSILIVFSISVKSYLNSYSPPNHTLRYGFVLKRSRKCVLENQILASVLFISFTTITAAQRSAFKAERVISNQITARRQFAVFLFGYALLSYFIFVVVCLCRPFVLQRGMI